MTCATLTEAEALVSGGITDILISSELVGDRKISRFVELSQQAEVKAVVDNPKAVAALGAAGRGKECSLSVLVNVNVGQNRTGVRPGELAVRRQLGGIFDLPVTDNPVRFGHVSPLQNAELVGMDSVGSPVRRAISRPCRDSSGWSSNSPSTRRR